MSYNSNIHHRKSTRLKGYDYSREGLYFITICTYKKECLFSEIINDEMILNHAGKIADKYWLDIPKHFPNAVLHERVIMPNHVHGIIEIHAVHVGSENLRDNVGAENLQPLHHGNLQPLRNAIKTQTQHEFQKMIPLSIGSIIKGFKIGVTKYFRNNSNDNFPNDNKIWQRNYHDHIIRDEQSYIKISEYIINNPRKWKEDKFWTI